MERFIGKLFSSDADVEGLFKIQYGEIYSLDESDLRCANLEFKIQYGEIYSASL